MSSRAPGPVALPVEGTEGSDAGRARVVRVVGALVEAEPMPGVGLFELVRVGERGLLGEVIRIKGLRATVQVFEETSGVALEEPVERTGRPLTAELGPGLLGSVLDGVGRPLDRLATGAAGPFLEPGLEAPTLDRERRWEFRPELEPGSTLEAGDVLGRVRESRSREHLVLVPPGVNGVLAELGSGSFTVEEAIGRLEGGEPLRLAHRWPVRRPRPDAERLPPDRPLVTGQRIFDLLFPVAEGGTVAVPGGFGTGKTIIEQSLAKFADAEVVVFVGCGERGNEMAELLQEFSDLSDPRAGGSIMERTVLIVNTSNMPVAARESSVYLGITVAEYYRDMGYRVALLADSLSRWAEALREIGSRLQELPGEEGYPTYLANRLAKAYERAGRSLAAGSPERAGAVTLVSAVSPPGGDFSEPVTQASLRVCGALWALDAGLAHQRQFPAVDWETSYTLYAEGMEEWFREHGGVEWSRVRRELLELLQKDRELREVAGLVGPEGLEDRDRLVLELARIARDLVLGQSAFDPRDAFSPLARTYALARLLVGTWRTGEAALAGGAGFGSFDPEAVREALDRVRRAEAEGLEAAVEAAERRIASAAGEREEGTAGTRRKPLAGRPGERAFGGAEETP